MQLLRGKEDVPAENVDEMAEAFKAAELAGEKE
jgi:hypothetical protein